MTQVRLWTGVLGPASLTLSMAAISCSAEEERDLGTPVTDNPCPIPVDDLDALVDWLRAKNYSNWPAESSLHDSAGPHFGNVRTWISEELDSSLRDGNDSHPLCAATVKELYGDDDSLGGVSLSVKVTDDGTSSDWFWFEVYNDEILAGGTDVDICVDCHGRGTDYLLSAYPLR